MLTAWLKSFLFGIYSIFTNCVVQHYGVSDKLLWALLQSWVFLLDYEGIQSYCRAYKVVWGYNGAISMKISHVVHPMWVRDLYIPLWKGVHFSFMALVLGLHCASTQFTGEFSPCLAFHWWKNPQCVSLFRAFFSLKNFYCCHIYSDFEESERIIMR